MKKIYSILALAAFMFCAEANAQRITVDSKATVAEINRSLSAYKAEEVAEIDVTMSTVDLTDAEIVSPNPNAIILVNDKAQVKNTVNVLPIKELVDGTYYMDKLVITDKAPFLTAIQFDALTASYTREVSNEYNTLCLPFCLRVTDFPDYNFEYLKEVADDETLVFTRLTKDTNPNPDGKYAGHLSSGTPCIIHLHNFNEGGENIIEINTNHAVSVNKDEPASYPMNEKMNLVGHFAPTTLTAENSANVLYIQDNMFWKYEDFKEPVQVPAFRCTIEANKNQPLAKSYKIVSVDPATGVKTIISSLDDEPVYNFQGIRVAANAKGFVIKNGKKYFNK